MKVNALEDPLDFIVSLGNGHDKPYAGLLANDQTDGYLIADRSHACDKLRS